MPNYQTIPIPIATNGLNKDLQPTQIPSASPNMVNMFVENWGVRKRLGYSSKGINLPLSGIGMELIQYVDARGDVHQLACTTTSVYQYDSSFDQWLNICAPTTIENCEDAWVNDNVNTCAAQATTKKVGTNAILINITSDIAATTLLCHEAVSETDISSTNIFTMWIRCDKALSANSIKIVLSETAAGSDPKTGTEGTNYISLLNPIAMVADTWYSINIPLTGDAVPTNMDKIVNVAIYSNTATELDGDTTATNLYIDDLKVTTGFTGTYSNRFSHTIAHDAAEFTNNGGTALVLSNNVDAIQYFEGDNEDTLTALDVSDFTGLSNVKEIEEFWNHFFAINYTDTATNIRSLAYTDLGDIDDWTTGTSGSNTLTDTKGKLLRAKKLGSDMIIYSENSITTCRYIGSTVLFTFPTLVYETGLFSEKAIWDFVNAHYFMGTDQKIYAYQGGQQLISIGDAIEESMFGAIDVSKKDRISLGLDINRHKLYFFFPTSSETYAKNAYVYNYKQNPATWEYHEFNDTIRDFSLFDNKLGWYADGPELEGTYADETTFYADASNTQCDFPTSVILTDDSYIYKLDEAFGLDNTTNIACTYETMDINYDTEEHYFRTSWVSFNMMSAKTDGTYDLYYSTDSGSTWTEIGTDYDISDGVANSWTQHRHPIDINARKIRFKLEQDSSKDLRIRASHIKMQEQTDRE